MTREEALLKVGELVAYARTQGWDVVYTDAFKTLEQESCGDVISRQIVIDKIKEVCFSKEQKWINFRLSYGSNGQRDYIIKFIESLPCVKPIDRDVI